MNHRLVQRGRDGRVADQDAVEVLVRHFQQTFEHIHLGRRQAGKLRVDETTKEDVHFLGSPMRGPVAQSLASDVEGVFVGRLVHDRPVPCAD